MITRRVFSLAFFLIALPTAYCLLPTSLARADSISDLQAQIDANNRQLAALSAKIAEYQQQLATIGTEKSTLQSAINSLTLEQKKLTTQTQVTQAKIVSANLQIQKLSHSIGAKEENIAEDQDAIAKALRTIAQGEQTSLIAQLISSDSLGNAWRTADQTIQFNQALAHNISDLRTVRATLSANRDSVTSAKVALVALQNDLVNQQRAVTTNKKAQQSLLAQTKNKESNYQKLLAQARAELAAFSAFTTNAGGSKLLANQTSCDAWGCYYSQRDTLWGNVPLSGTRERLAAAGCLVTSMAMILTHYGHRGVTPVSINADPGNFSPVGGLLLFTINVDGATATRKAAAIDATLSSGDPVVIGIHAYGGTHFVVFTSGSRGQYLMRDPYVANGKDISFTAHYSLGAIFGISRVIVSG